MRRKVKKTEGKEEMPWFGSQVELLLCSRLNACLYGSSQPAGLYMCPWQERRPPRFPMKTFLLESFAKAMPTTEGNTEVGQTVWRLDSYQQKQTGYWDDVCFHHTICLQVSRSFSRDTFSSWENTTNNSCINTIATIRRLHYCHTWKHSRTPDIPKINKTKK